MGICLSANMVLTWCFYYCMWMISFIQGTILPSLLLWFNNWVLILTLKILVSFTTFFACRLTILILVYLSIKLSIRLICQHLLPNDNPLLTNPSSCRSLVGALQYLTITRPDLSIWVILLKITCKLVNAFWGMLGVLSMVFLLLLAISLFVYA